MIEVAPQTWITLAALASFALALFGYLGAMRRDLHGEIAGVDQRLTSVRDELEAEIAATRSELKGEIAATRSELKGEIAATRTELKADIKDLGGRLTVIEQRTYDLAKFAAVTDPRQAQG